MTIHQPILSLHNILSKTDAAYWSLYWHTTPTEIPNYPHYIAALVDTLIATKTKRLFIVSQDRAYFLAALLAALHTGIPAVLPPLATVPALKALLKNSDALATDQIHLAEVAPLLIPLLGDQSKNTSPCKDFFSIDPQQAKIIFYTSGSTGAPKAIEKSLAQLEAEIATLESIWGRADKNILFLSTVAHHHIYGLLFSLLWPVCAGYRIARTTFSFWQDILHHQDSNAHYIISSPAHLGRFPITQKVSKSPAHIFSSGGALSYDAAQATLAFLNILPTEVYGSTETGGIAYRQQKMPATPWTRFNNIPLRETTEKQLCIQSPYLPHRDWHQTDDQVTLINENQFHLLGRIDRIVKIEGKRVALAELEQKLMMLDIITEATVLPLTNATRDELAAIIVLSAPGQEKFAQQGKAVVVRELRHHLTHYFDQVAVPRKWRFVAEIPRNAQGKKIAAELKTLFKMNKEF